MMIRKILMLLASMALAVLVVGSAALAADIICGSDPCFGTDEADHIDGTDSAEVIRALDGDDTIDGLDGEDTLHGNPGNDYRFIPGEGSREIAGGNGDDTSFGGAGNDFLAEFDRTGRNDCGVAGWRPRSCTGNDTQRGSEGDDLLEGADEGDFLHGSQGRDVMVGGRGNDVMRGGRVPDRMFGSSDNDVMRGDRGRRDRIMGLEGSDRLIGNRENDIIDAAQRETPASRDTISCGRGRGRVEANRNDVVRRNCERVTRVPNPTVAPTSEDRDSLQEKALKEFVANNKP
jgi:Ca2+-binding RTX toxin-like protein